MSDNPQRQEFDVTLFKDEGSSGVGFIVPFSVEDVFGAKAQVKVRGTIDGHPYRGSIAPHSGKYYMVVRRDLREALAKTGGDTIHVVMERDPEEHAITVPDDFREALSKNKAVKVAFDQLPYAHRKEWIDWIEGAKRPQTRGNRIAKALEKIAGGVKAPG